MRREITDTWLGVLVMAEEWRLFNQSAAGWLTLQAVWWRGWKHPTIHKLELEVWMQFLWIRMTVLWKWHLMEILAKDTVGFHLCISGVFYLKWQHISDRKRIKSKKHRAKNTALMDTVNVLQSSLCAADVLKPQFSRGERCCLYCCLNTTSHGSRDTISAETHIYV